jgi:hypothetical protein
MSKDKREEPEQWQGVIARCLAYLCLKNSEYADGSMQEQARFLRRMGLPIEERGTLVGSSAESLKAMERAKRSKKKRGKPRAKTSKR